MPIVVRVVVAPCAFKGTLPARTVSRVLARALRRRHFVVDECPLPDGGEGTVQALVQLGAAAPAGRPIRQATDGVDVVVEDHGAARTLWIESAAFIGLPVDRRQRDGSLSSWALGRVVRHHLERHDVARVVIALGGTGVVDGGAGFLAALGPRSSRGRGGVSFLGLVDVDAALCGPRGARLYFAQKGVPYDRFDDVEARLRALHPRFVDVKGAGAAGGLGAAILSLGGRLVSGASFVVDAAGLDARVAAADVVIGGEGRVDEQTLQGKSLAALRALATKHKKPLVVVCGRCVVDGFANVVVELGDDGITDPVGALTRAARSLAL